MTKNLPAAPKKPRQRFMFRVTPQGTLAPADERTRMTLRQRGYRVNDLLLVDISKPRSPGFWRLAHQIGTLCRENIDEFADFTSSHEVLKRLQMDSGVECDETTVELPGFGQVIHRMPRSLSFESMDEDAVIKMAEMTVHETA